MGEIKNKSEIDHELRGDRRKTRVEEEEEVYRNAINGEKGWMESRCDTKQSIEWRRVQQWSFTTSAYFPLAVYPGPAPSSSSSSLRDPRAELKRVPLLLPVTWSLSLIPVTVDGAAGGGKVRLEKEEESRKEKKKKERGRRVKGGWEGGKYKWRERKERV